VNLSDLTADDGAAAGAEVGLDAGPEAAAADRYLVARAGGQRVAVPLLDAREIVTVRAVTRLPGAPSWIAGLVNVRGAVLTVLDLACRLGAAPCAGPVVLVEVEGRRFGVRVDAVVGVVRAGEGVTPVDEARSADGAVRGLVTVADAPALVLDLVALQRAAIAEA
jgi:purine-binding chemotaxis protein CheW